MPLEISRIRAICFDVDGTLNDTDDVYVDKLCRFLQPFHLLIPKKDARRLARRLVMWSEAPGNVFISLPDWLGIDDELAAAMAWLNHLRPRPMTHYRLISGIRDMIDDLSRRFPLAVVSARDAASTGSFLERFALGSSFSAVVSGQSARRSKPHPDPIFLAARQMGVAPGDCLMVGDTTVDIRAGKRAGAQTVGVLCGFGERPELEGAGADLVLENTPDLLKVLEHLPGMKR